MIRAGDKISTILRRDPALLEVLVDTSPAVARLRNAAVRSTMARLVTVEQAARIAGIEARVLLDRLNGASSASEPPAAEASGGDEQAAPDPLRAMPDALRAMPPEAIVDLDVRAELRAGGEPFQRILAAIRSLPDGGALRLRAVFEPAPLYTVLGRQGFAHFTEHLDHEDWRVWFYRAPTPAPAPAPAPEPEDHELGDDIVILDVRGLEPPEPMVRTLDALSRLPPGKTLLQINVRTPQFLLPKLRQRGFAYEIREQSEDLVRIFIRHAQE